MQIPIRERVQLIASLSRGGRLSGGDLLVAGALFGLLSKVLSPSNETLEPVAPVPHDTSVALADGPNLFQLGRESRSVIELVAHFTSGQSLPSATQLLAAMATDAVEANSLTSAKVPLAVVPALSGFPSVIAEAGSATPISLGFDGSADGVDGSPLTLSPLGRDLLDHFIEDINALNGYDLDFPQEDDFIELLTESGGSILLGEGSEPEAESISGDLEGTESEFEVAEDIADIAIAPAVGEWAAFVPVVSTSVLGSTAGGLVADLAAGGGFSGAVIDGYVENALVFIDRDADGIWDINEEWDITNVNGAYSFIYTGDISGFNIVTDGSYYYDSASNTVYTDEQAAALGLSSNYLITAVDVTTLASVTSVMKSSAAVSGYVTPLSTVYALAGGGSAGDALLAQLNLSAADLTYDPSAAGTANAAAVLKAGASLLTIVSNAATLMSESEPGRIGLEAASISVFSQIAAGSVSLSSLLSSTEASASTAIQSLLTTTFAASNLSISADVISATASAAAGVTSALQDLNLDAVKAGGIYALAATGQTTLLAEIKSIAQTIASGGIVDSATLTTLSSTYAGSNIASVSASAATKLAFNKFDPSNPIATEADTVVLAAPTETEPVSGTFNVLANDSITGGGQLQLGAVGLFDTNAKNGKILALDDPENGNVRVMIDGLDASKHVGMRLDILTANGPVSAEVTSIEDVELGEPVVLETNLTNLKWVTLDIGAIDPSAQGATYLVSKALPPNIELGIENNQVKVTNTYDKDYEFGELQLVYVAQSVTDPTIAKTGLLSVNVLPPKPTVSFANNTAKTFTEIEGIDGATNQISGTLSANSSKTYTVIDAPITVSGLGISGTVQIRGLPDDAYLRIRKADNSVTTEIAKDVGSPNWTITGANALALSAPGAQIEFLLPSNLSGNHSLIVVATSRYGGLSSRTTDTATIKVTPNADGLTAQTDSGSILQGVVPDTTEDTAFSFAPESVPGGFDISAFLDSLTLKDNDGSERIGLRIEFADPSAGWTYSFTNSAAKYREISGGLEVFDHDGRSLADAIRELSITPPQDFSGPGTLQVTPGSFEVATTIDGIPPSDGFKVLDEPFNVSVEVEAVAEDILLIGGLSTAGLENQNLIALPLENVIDPSKLEQGDSNSVLGDERLSIEVTLTRSVALLNKHGVAQLPSAITETTATYVLDVAQKTYSTELSGYALKPNANYASPLAGDTISVKVTAYEPSNGAVADAKSETISLVITPVAGDPGAPLAVRSQISIAESQPAIGGQQASVNWVAATDAIRLPISSDTLATGETLKVIVTVSNKLVLATKTVTGSIATHTNLVPTTTSSDGLSSTYLLTPAQYAQLEVRGSDFESGSGTLTATLRSEEVWGESFKDGDPITVTVALRPVASGVAKEPTLKSVTTAEDSVLGVKLSELVATPAVLNDASETLLYKVFIPSTAKLFAVLEGGNLGVASASTVTVDGASVSGLSYTLTEAQLDQFEVRPVANFSGTLPLQYQAIGREDNGASAVGGLQTVSLVVDPVSDTPILVAPSAVTGLVGVPSETLIPVPLQLVRTDSTGTPEVLTARIKIDGITSASDVQFFLGTNSPANALTVTGTSTTGFFINLDSTQVAKLSTLAVTSTKDFRGDGKLTLTVTGNSQDGSAPVASKSTTVDLTLYQPIAPPTFTLFDVDELRDMQVAVQTKAAIGFSVGLPNNAPTGLKLEDVSVLLTGAPAQAYFVVKSGTGQTATYTPVGSSLGEGGAWLFSAKDLYNFTNGVPTTSKTLVIINAGADITSTLSAQAFVSDPVGGTGNQSNPAESLAVTFNVANKDLTDPLILSVDGSALSSSAASGLEFDLDTYFAGNEQPTYWVSGDAASKTRFAFVVRPEVSAGQVDSIVDLYDDFAAFAKLDVNSDSVVTGDELLGVQLWFDKDKDAVADEGELVDLLTTLPGFTVDLQTMSTARAASSGQIIPLYEASASWGGVNSASLFAVAVPYQNAVLPVAGSTTTPGFSSAPTAAVIMVGQPTAAATVQVPEDLPGGIPFRIDLAEAVTTAGNSTHLIKVYGVPSTASLSLGAKITLESGDSFWLLTEDQIARNISIIGLPEHYTGTISLTAQAVASVITGTGATTSVSTVSGALSSAAVAVVTGVADTPLLSANTDAITINEGGDLYLTADGQVWANALDDIDIDIAALSSPDTAEALYVRFKLDADADDFVVTGTSYLGTTDLGANTHEVLYANAKNVVISFDPFFSDDVVLTLQGVSKQGSSVAFSRNTSAISVGFTPVADGVEAFTSFPERQSVYEGGAAPDNLKSFGPTVDGALSGAPTLNLSAKPVDEKEAVRFEVLIGGGADVAEAITSVSGAIEQTLSTAEQSGWGLTNNDLLNWKLFSVDATRAADGSYTASGLKIELDTYFDGSITHKSRAVSIDPSSGVESIPAVATLQTGTIAVDPKVVSNAYSIEIFKLKQTDDDLVRDGLASDVELKERGVSGWFEVNAQAFDPDETILLAESFSLPVGFSVFIDPNNPNRFQIKHDGSAPEKSDLSFSPSVTLTDGLASLTETASKVALSISLDINDAPTVVGVPRVNGSIVEGATLTGAGSISFADLDLTDRPTAAEVTKSVLAVKADGTALSLTAGQREAIVQAFSIAPAANNTNNGSINWAYSIAETSLDFLAAGERVNAVFTVAIDDGQATVEQDVTVTITGTNDAPTLIFTDADVRGLIVEGLVLSDSGSISFADLDLTDRPTAAEVTKSVLAVKADGTALSLTAGQREAIVQAFSIAPAANNTNNGSINWAYSIAETSLDFLGEGERVTAAFAVTVRDNLGATATQDVTVSITGTNDAPELDLPQEANLLLRESARSLIPGIRITDYDSSSVTITLRSDAGLLDVAFFESNTFPTVLVEERSSGALRLSGSPNEINEILSAGGGVIFDAVSSSSESSFIEIEVTDDAGATATRRLNLRWKSEIAVVDRNNSESIFERLLNPAVEVVTFKVESSGRAQVIFTGDQWEEAKHLFSKVLNPEKISILVEDVSAQKVLSFATDDRVDTVELLSDEPIEMDSEAWLGLQGSNRSVLSKIRKPDGDSSSNPTVRIAGLPETHPLAPFHASLLSGLNMVSIVWAVSLSNWENVHLEYLRLGHLPDISIAITDWEWDPSTPLSRFEQVTSIMATDAHPVISFDNLTAWQSFRDQLLMKVTNPSSLAISLNFTPLPADLRIPEFEVFLMAKNILSYGESTDLGGASVTVYGVSAENARSIISLPFVDQIELDPQQSIFISQSDWDFLLASKKFSYTPIGSDVLPSSGSSTFIDPNLGYVVSSHTALWDINFSDYNTSIIKGPAYGDNTLVGQSTETGKGGALFAGTGNDLIIGGIGHDYLFGDDGDDIFVPLGQADVIVGGRGADVVEISADVYYEEIERTQMHELISKILRSSPSCSAEEAPSFESLVCDYETQAKLAFESAYKTAQGPGADDFSLGNVEVNHKFVGVWKDYTPEEKLDITGFDFTSSATWGDLTIAYAANFSDLTSSSGESSQVTFTSIMLISDYNSWCLDELSLDCDHA